MKIAKTLLVVLGVFLGYVALKPSHYEISRSVTIQAPADKVFPFVNTRTLANSWNPFILQDADIKLSYAGPEVGVGSQTHWESSKQMGVGTATVIESIPNQKVLVKLEYTKPFRMHQEAAFLLASQGSDTILTWKAYGENNFFSRVLCTFVNMDKKVGDSFAVGLQTVKNRVEQSKPAK